MIYTGKIFSMLMELYEPNDIVKWLETPQSLLDGGIPEKMIESGQAWRVYDELKRIMHGVYV